MVVGSHIGQYRIVRKIGSGGMGNVFLGEHTLLGRRAAIKTLLPALSSNRELVERFFNEARATSSIVDPGIIQIFDFGYHVDGTAYIVMELLEGEALSARIDRLGRLPPSEALRIARQGAGSLAAAHANAIVHRDLKPQNIFLVRDAEARGGERTKILDFGICKQGGTTDPALTQSGAMIGTPVYMSPEQCRGLGEIDHRSDVYAFGCLMFHMLTGRPPFVGQAPGDLIVAHLRELPPAPSTLLPELPPAIDDLLARCLAKDPADRFQTMLELQQAIDEIDAQFGESPATELSPRLTVQLGTGFRSVYQGSLSSPPPHDSSAIPPMPNTWSPKQDSWMVRNTPVPVDEVYRSYDSSARRSGLRTFLMITAGAAILALAIIGSQSLAADDASAAARPAPAAAAIAPPVVAPSPPKEATVARLPPHPQAAVAPASRPPVVTPVKRRAPAVMVPRRIAPRPKQADPVTEDLYDAR